MPTILSDLRYGLRTLRAAPTFTAVALLSLALGIGANTTIFSIANGLLFTELPVPHPEQLARVVRGQHSPLDYDELQYMQSHAASAIAVMGERLTSGTLTAADGRVERFDGAFVTGNYFSGLGLRPALGRFFAQPDDRPSAEGPVVVLSYAFWQTRFGADPSIIGRQLRLNDQSFTVVGVAPPSYVSSVLGWRPSAWLPLSDYSLFTGQTLRDWNGSIYTTARLAPGVGRQRAAVELASIAAQLRQVDSAKYARLNFRVLPARGLEEEARIVIAGIATAMLVLVGLVLLIACANVANLLLARAAGRRREIGVRLALGASRARLIQQLLAESLLLALGGGVLGLAGSFALTKTVVHLIPVDVPVSLDIAPDERVLAFTLILSVLTGLAFGLAPALRASRLDLVGSLKDDVSLQGLRRSRLRSSLLIVQVTVGLVLIAVAAMFAQSLRHAKSMDPGFREQGVVNLRVDLRPRHYDDQRALAVFQELLARARALPGVQSATLASTVLLEGSNSEFTVQIGERQPQAGTRPPTVSYDAVGSDYFKTLTIPIVTGRAINAADIAGKLRVAVISESMARHFWAGRSPLGQTMRLGGSAAQPYEIVGVARDVTYYMIGDVGRDLVFLPVTDGYQPSLALQVRTDLPASVIGPQLESLAQQLEPSLPRPKAKAMRDDMSLAYLPARIGAAVFGGFGVLALIIAMVGIYGVTSYIVAQRTRELGLRSALGAQPAALIGAGIRDTLRLVLIGIAIGVPAAFGVSLALTSLPILYDAHANDPLVLGGATALLLVVAAIAGYLPARRAARADPLISLRAE
jgi:predicted permease